MNTPKKSCQLLSAMVVALAAAGLSSPANGQDHHDLRGPHVVLDARYHHDRYYPARGYVVERLPIGSVGITFGTGQYFFHGGVWFRPVGPRFEVVTPPIGIVLSTLPSGYVTLTLGGAVYYYANGVYYAPAAGAGYTVVAPPVGADMALVVEPPVASIATQAPQANPQTSGAAAATHEPVVYPRNVQSPAQTNADRKQCQQWAATQAATGSGADIFNRAHDACLDGRGYTVR